ncbi:uncharacterized protein [Rutidosis leptorrhynchoides]|uniref:uncharacterized protein n=1 Tax=Rutidosis leptorrhynchoides TaxID=125765 RepID=UPI003A99DDA6
MRTKQTARGSGMKLKYQVMDAGNKLINVSSSSSTPVILNVLLELENVLRRMHTPSKATIKALHPIIQDLITERLKHPDMNVNISAVCCICEIFRIMAHVTPYDHQQHIKDFFEALVTSFEKQSSASGGYCAKMTRVLEIFSKSRLLVMMLDIKSEELVGRLFKQFLSFADSNNSTTVHKMEGIMTMIIEESGEALALEALIITTLGKINKIASPSCWQLGEKVLKNCDAKLTPRSPDMAKDEAIVTNLCTSDTSQFRNDTTHKIKLEQTLSGCQVSTKDGISLIGAHSHDEKNAVSLTSNCATEVNGERKRDNEQEVKGTNPCTNDTNKLRNDTNRKIKLEPLEESIKMEQTLIVCQDSTRDDVKNAVSFDDPSATSNCVTEVNGKRKRRNDQQQRVPKKVLYSMIRVQGYKIKKSNAPILEAIFKKHGDIASNCVVKTASVRESILEVICEVVIRIQTNDFATIISNMEEIEMKVLGGVWLDGFHGISLDLYLKSHENMCLVGVFKNGICISNAKYKGFKIPGIDRGFQIPPLSLLLSSQIVFLPQILSPVPSHPTFSH